MTDSNHEPFSERERLAGIIEDVLTDCGEFEARRVSFAAADAILEDPTYARVRTQDITTARALEIVLARCNLPWQTHYELETLLSFERDRKSPDWMDDAKERGEAIRREAKRDRK